MTASWFSMSMEGTVRMPSHHWKSRQNQLFKAGCRIQDTIRDQGSTWFQQDTWKWQISFIFALKKLSFDHCGKVPYSFGEKVWAKFHPFVLPWNATYHNDTINSILKPTRNKNLLSFANSTRHLRQELWYAMLHSQVSTDWLRQLLQCRYISVWKADLFLFHFTVAVMPELTQRMVRGSIPTDTKYCGPALHQQLQNKTLMRVYNGEKALGCDGSSRYQVAPVNLVRPLHCRNRQLSTWRVETLCVKDNVSSSCMWLRSEVHYVELKPKTHVKPRKWTHNHQVVLSNGLFNLLNEHLW